MDLHSVPVGKPMKAVMKICSKCKRAPALDYHAYCWGCKRIAQGRPIELVRHVDPENKLCCHCRKNPRRPFHNYCAECGPKLYKAWIAKRGGYWAILTPEQREKCVVRRFMNHRIERGKAVRQPCFWCGDPNSELHHGDYNPRTRNVIFLCHKHHIMGERLKRKGLTELTARE